MTLRDDLSEAVKNTFKNQWTTRDGREVPSDDSIKLGNDAVKLKATVLYADMADSTKLVDNHPAWFAAEMYKTYLYCAGRIIRSEGGTITAYDGDRIMAVFIGDSKNTSSVRAAMKIRRAVSDIIMPLKNEKYPDKNFTLKHTVGIDTSELFVAKTGIRGANDLVWVGRAANHAAKMAALNDGYTYISADIYNHIADETKYSNGENMWSTMTWAFTSKTIYYSNWWWEIT